MRHKFFTIICMLCMFDVHGKTIKNHPSTSQASVNILSLEEAMILAQKTHPEVLETLPAKDAAMYRGHQAKALRLPVLEGRVGAGREYLRQKFSRNKLNPFPLEGSVNEKRADSTLSLRQPLFDGYEATRQIEKAKRETHQASLKTAEIQELIAFKAGDQYIALRRFSRLYKLAKKNVAAHREILNKINTLIDAGKATTVDRESATARTEDAEASMNDIEGNYTTALAHFIDIVGVEPPQLSNAEIPSHLVPDSLEEALKLAQTYNKSLNLAKVTKEVAKTDTEISKATLYPRVGIEVDGTKRFHAGGKPGSEDNLTAQVVMKYNFYNGGRDLARTKELRSKAQQAHYAMLREKRNAEREIRISMSERHSSYKQALALRESSLAKEKVVKSYREQFDAGRRSFLDILDAQHEYFLSVGSKITTEATYDLANLRALASMGLLTKRLIHKAPLKKG